MEDYKKCWRKKAREYLALAFGGKCTICGYDKTIAALDYHHIDPSEKDFELAIAMRNGGSWAKTVEEARKCTIVCCRCHREIHAGVTEVPVNCVRFNEEFANIIKLKEKEFDICPVCRLEKPKKQKFCSSNCSHVGVKKFDVSNNDLVTLVDNSSYEAVGRMFGVTGKAIKKRLMTARKDKDKNGL